MSCVLVRVHYVMHTTVMRTNAMPTNVRHINAVCTNVMCTSAMCSNVMCTDVMCTSTYCYVWLSVCIPRETSKLISQDSVKYVHITKSILNLKLSWLVQTLPTMPPWLLSLFHSQFCCCVYLQLCSAVSGIWLWKKIIFSMARLHPQLTKFPANLFYMLARMWHVHAANVNQEYVITMVHGPPAYVNDFSVKCKPFQPTLIMKWGG